MIRLLGLALWLVALPCTADIYTYTDAQGNRVFTDQPNPGKAKRIELQPSNRLSQPSKAAPPASQASTPVKPQKKRYAPYQMLRILVPLPEANLREENGEVIVTATSDPALQPGHQLRLLLDGKPAGEPSTSPVFSLRNVDRGAHKLAVEIINQQGAVIERTAAQTFYLQRISLAQKKRIHPCKKADYGVRPECPLSEKPDDEEESSILPFF